MSIRLEKTTPPGAAREVEAPRSHASSTAAPVFIEAAPRPSKDSAIAFAMRALTPKARSLHLMRGDEVEAKVRSLASCGVKVDEIGRSREGRSIYGLTVGHGPIKVVSIAGAHPDEPVGTVTSLFVAEKLATDPRLRPLLDRITLHIVPQANPDGSAKNEAWLDAWSSKKRGAADARLLSYFKHVHRDSPKDDVEFGFPNTPQGQARPENAAIAAWFDGLGHIDHYASLHSMFLGGGALFLVRATDLEASAPSLRFLLDEAQAHGLPLHDKDRFGQKGFHRICAGLMTAPTAEEMAAFFQGGKQAEVAAQFKLNSMQYVSRFQACPLAFVSEIPLCYDPRLASMKPVAVRRADEELRLARALLGVLDEAGGLASKLREAGAPEAAVARFEAEVKSGRAGAAALEGDLGRYGDAPATEGNVLETELTLLRRRAGFLAHALAIAEPIAGPVAGKVAAEIEGRLEATITEIKERFDLRYPTLETQVRLQSAALIGALVRTEART